MPNISLIAAVQTPNNGIGFEGDLLHKIPEDMKRFRTLTAGHPIIMGRKTFDSIGRLLPKRLNVILTTASSLLVNGDGDFVIADNISRAMKFANLAKGNDEVFIIGGEKVYADFLPFANKLYLTLIAGDKQADAFFPKFDDSQWEEVYHLDAEYKDTKYCFTTLVRKV